MSYKETHEGSSRRDHRFIAEATTETGVTLRGTSRWEPGHWDRDKPRREAEADLRAQFKSADIMKVSIGKIRIYRETRLTERVTREWTSRKFLAEVTR